MTLLAVALLASCVTVTSEPRAVLLDPGNNTVRVERRDCTEASARARTAPHPAGKLDPARIRIVSWNIHKQADHGWRDDLARFVADADLVLLQEIVLRPDVRTVIEDAGLQWTLASSFLDGRLDIGVLTAARVAPIATCTQRIVEPLLRLPKSAVITWYALAGRSTTLAVANMHSINFSVSLGAYRAQLAAMRDTLAEHQGPIIFAGDLNTWTAERAAAVREAAAALGLEEIRFREDHRRVFLGKQLDHIFVRGLTISTAFATRVTSSDHNPVHATLHVAGAPP